MSDLREGPNRGGDEVPDRPPVQSAWMARWSGGASCSSSSSRARDTAPLVRCESREDGVSGEGEGLREGRMIEFMSGRGGVGESRSGKFGTWSGGNVGPRGGTLPSVLALAPSGLGGLGSGNRVWDDGFGERDRLAGSSSHRAPFRSLCDSEEDINGARRNIQVRDLLGGGFRGMPGHSGVRFIPGESRHLEGTGLFGEFYERSRMVPRMPSSVRDMGTMRIYTTIDTVAESSRGPSKYSQTTHHFVITKKADANMAGAEEEFRQSTVSTEFKGKAAREFVSLSPDFTFPGRQGLTLKSLDGSTESDEKEKIDTSKSSAVDLKNESSAETDTMDMDALRVNNPSGIASSLLNKDVKEDEQKLRISNSSSHREKSQGRMLTSELPDINKPAVPGVAATADENEATTSRTQSLDMEHFLLHAKSPMKRSGSDPDGSSGSDPCSRWVKRLKPSSSEAFPHGTKISKMEQASPHLKVKLSKILGCNKSSSEPVNNKSYDREMMVMDQTGASTRDSKSLSSGSTRESQEITLAHAWIQRWCRNSNAFLRKRHGSALLSEQQGSKVADYEEKQLPSIAAMALMGKAMTGFPPCELRKRGALLIWNTEGC